MIAFDKLETAPFLISGDFEKYVVYDEWGSVIGVKDDAPDEFKKAFEHDRKIREDAKKQGIIL